MPIARLQYNAKHPITNPKDGIITRPFYYWVQAVEAAVQSFIIGLIPIPNSVLTSDNLNVVAFRTVLPAVDGNAVTNLNASALATGTVPLARLSGITNAQLAANAGILLTQLQDISTDRLVGRDTAGSGPPEQLTVSGGIEFTGAGGIQTSAFTGDVTKAAGGTVLTLASGVVESKGYWSPLTDGDPDETELIFADGDAIMVWVPTP